MTLEAIKYRVVCDLCKKEIICNDYNYFYEDTRYPSIREFLGDRSCISGCKFKMTDEEGQREITDWIRIGTFDLCPDCAMELDRFLSKFKREG